MPAQPVPPEAGPPARARRRSAGQPRRHARASDPAQTPDPAAFDTTASIASAPGFYAGVLDPADREALVAAGVITGLDQEIAVLRTRLRRLLRDQPDDHALAVRAIELLVRAVAAAGRLSPAETDGVLEQISTELDGILKLLAEAQANPP